MYFLMDFIKSNFVCLREEMYTHVWCLRGRLVGGVVEKREQIDKG